MMKEDLMREGEAFTKVSLQLEVRRYQCQIMQELMMDGGVKVPQEIERML